MGVLLATVPSGLALSDNCESLLQSAINANSDPETEAALIDLRDWLRTGNNGDGVVCSIVGAAPDLPPPPPAPEICYGIGGIAPAWLWTVYIAGLGIDITDPASVNWYGVSGGGVPTRQGADVTGSRGHAEVESGVSAQITVGPLAAAGTGWAVCDEGSGSVYAQGSTPAYRLRGMGNVSG